MLRGILVALALVALTAACGGDAGRAGELPLVAVSLYPLEFVAVQVAGDRADVTTLTPPGVEPHDVELTPRQVVAASEADLLVYAGEGFQPAVEELAEDRAAAAFDVLDVEGLRLVAAGGDADDADHGPEHANDPHVWLDPIRLARIAEAVAERLGELDPDAESSYRANAAALVAELETLDGELREALDDCRRAEVIVSHEAFGYLADRYGFEQVGISGVDPEAEPTPQRVAEVARLVEERDVPVVFFEKLIPADVAEAIAAETGARIDVLDPLESAPARGDYFDAMRTNLTSLRRALECR